MKKMIAMLLALSLTALLFVGCSNKTADNGATTEATTEATTGVVIEDAVSLLSEVWALYGDDEKFPVMGGDMENAVMDAPGTYNITTDENLPYVLYIPVEEMANIDDAATLVHAMNANTFTGGALHLAEGVDVAAFAATLKDAIMSTQWMCGFPEKLIIASVGDNYIVVAFGLNDAMTPFKTHLTAAYAGAEFLFEEDIV